MLVENEIKKQSTPEVIVYLCNFVISYSLDTCSVSFLSTLST